MPGLLFYISVVEAVIVSEERSLLIDEGRTYGDRTYIHS